MGDEARQLAFLLEREEASAPLRRLAADSLNQLLHSADMIPEGTEALGYLETLFTFRMLAAELSEAAYSAPRLPKPRPPRPEPAAVPAAEVEPAEVAEPGIADAAPGAGGGSSALEAEGPAEEYGEAVPVAAGPAAEDSHGEAVEVEATETAAGIEGAEGWAREAEPAEAVAGAAAGGEGEVAAAELSEAELSEAGPSEAEPYQAELSEAEAAAPAAAAVEEEPAEEPERADASDESYAIARRLAPQAALVRSFLGADDAERLRRLVLEQRSRASRGRSSKEILLVSEARVAAASEAREWADLYEAPEFGSTQHDLLRLRSFMKTRVRRTAS